MTGSAGALFEQGIIDSNLDPYTAIGVAPIEDTALEIGMIARYIRWVLMPHVFAGNSNALGAAIFMERILPLPQAIREALRPPL
ncbi:MAG: hypothetical protein Q9223_001403 [Gallowayella weberi]